MTTERSRTELSEDPKDFLDATEFVDSDHPSVIAWAERLVASCETDAERAAALFLAVRDGLRYDPTAISRDPADYKASAIVETDHAYCIPKAVLLAAGARAVGIPARLGFADVRNHLSSEDLIAAMGTDVFVFHGYVELFIDGRWVKASPAFNAGLCDYFGVDPLDFDGVHDALLQQYDREGGRLMEYVRQRGVYTDLPLDEIREAFVETYGDGGV